MKFIVTFAVLMVMSASVSAIDKLSPEQKQEFLNKIAKECSDEIGFDLNAAMKLLLGDFTDSSDKAKVMKTRLLLVCPNLLIFPCCYSAL